MLTRSRGVATRP